MNKQAGKRSECAYHTLFESIVQMHFLQNGERERPVGGSLTLLGRRELLEHGPLAGWTGQLPPETN